MFSCNIDVLRLCTSCTADRGRRGTAVLYRHCGSLSALRPIVEWIYKFTLQAQKQCKFYTAHSASRGIAVPYRDSGSVGALRPVCGVEF